MIEQKITLEKFSQYINSKRDLYEAAIRNGYYLPHYNSSMITEDYLIGVINGSIWCLQYKDVLLLPCIKPPPKDILLEKLHYYLSKAGKSSSGINEKHIPNKSWILVVLSTLGSKDEIFDKNYLPPNKPKYTKFNRTVELPPSFLKGLPITKRKVNCRRLKMVSKSQSNIKLLKLNDMKQRIEERIKDEREKAKEKQSILTINKHFRLINKGKYATSNTTQSPQSNHMTSK